MKLGVNLAVFTSVTGHVQIIFKAGFVWVVRDVEILKGDGFFILRQVGSKLISIVIIYSFREFRNLAVGKFAL